MANLGALVDALQAGRESASDRRLRELKSGFGVPANREAEVNAVACAVAEGVDAINEADGVGLRAEHFVDPMLAQAWAELQDMRTTGEAVHIIPLLSRLKDRQPFDGEFEERRFQEELDRDVSVAAQPVFAREIRDAWERRELAEVLAIALRTTWQGKGLPHIHEDLADGLRAIERQRSEDMQEARSVFAAASATLGETGAIVPSGFAAVDQKLDGGFRGGDLVIVAARPSMGKSALITGVANNMTKQGYGCTVFSLEMKAQQLANRMIAERAWIPLGAIRTGNLSGQQHVDFAGAAGELSERPLTICDMPGLTFADIAQRARAQVERYGHRCIIVDYLQIMGGLDAANMNYAVGAITKGFKNLAKELNVPIILLSQLSRAVELRKPPIPIMSDLRDSGSIEQDADIIAMLYRPEYYLREGCPEDEKDLVNIIFVKQRDGATGTVDMRFHAPTASFHARDVF